MLIIPATKSPKTRNLLPMKSSQSRYCRSGYIFCLPYSQNASLMSTLSLFIDGSVNPKTRVGYGAYLSFIGPIPSLSFLQAQVQLRRFEATSSTQLELQNLIGALEELREQATHFLIYTDSQHIIRLPERRHRLEENNYFSKKGKRLKQADLYQKFYHLIDQVSCEFIKLQGHQASHQKREIDQVFSLVDKAARLAIRQDQPSI